MAKISDEKKAEIFLAYESLGQHDTKSVKKFVKIVAGTPLEPLAEKLSLQLELEDRAYEAVKKAETALNNIESDFESLSAKTDSAFKKIVKKLKTLGIL